MIAAPTNGRHATDKPVPGTRPEDIDAERALLAVCLAEPSRLFAAEPLLSGPEDFFIEAHGWIYEAMRKVQARGGTVAPRSVAAELRDSGRLDGIGGLAALNGLFGAGWVRTRDADEYARTVAENATKRKLITIGARIAGLGYESAGAGALLEQAEQLLFGLRAPGGLEAETLQQGMGALLDEIEAMSNNPEDVISGVPTGFRELDLLTGGYQKGDFITLGGVSKSGKTSLALDTVYSAATSRKNWPGCKVLVFSAEMTMRQIRFRALSRYSGIDLRRLRIGRLGDGEWGQLTEAHGILGNMAPVFIDTGRGLTISEVRARARRWKQRHPEIGLVIADYLQLFKGSTTRRAGTQTEETDSISEGFKWMAGELDLPVIALVQFNNEIFKRDKKVYLPSDFRNSGRIYQDSDLVLAVHRPEAFDAEADPAEAEIIIFGSRQGPRGNVPVRWIAETTHFEEMN